MATKINLDLINIMKTTSYGFNRTQSPLHEIYFRIHKNKYDVDMSKFNSLSLRIQSVVLNTGIDILTTTTTATLDGIEYVKFNLPAKYLLKMDTLLITPTVKHGGVSTKLQEFKLILYEENNVHMNSINVAIARFNIMYGLYLDSVKKDQIDRPNGIVGLDANGKINMNKMPLLFTEHIHDSIRFKETHGLKLNDKFMLEYYSPTEDEWVEMNSLFGGRFGYDNKPVTEDTLYNVVFGGYFEDAIVAELDALGFTDTLVDIVDGGAFDNNAIFKTVHGGTF